MKQIQELIVNGNAVEAVVDFTANYVDNGFGNPDGRGTHHQWEWEIELESVKPTGLKRDLKWNNPGMPRRKFMRFLKRFRKQFAKLDHYQFVSWPDLEKQAEQTRKEYDGD